jgi:hypothetical protein
MDHDVSKTNNLFKPQLPDGEKTLRGFRPKISPCRLKQSVIFAKVPGDIAIPSRYERRKTNVGRIFCAGAI